MTVKESRGRLSYLTPDRTKPITARKLGDAKPYPNTLPQLKSRYKGKTAKTTPADNTLQRMVDREAKRAEGKGAGL